MPVRSLSSPVFKWPDAKTVDQAIRQWAQDAVRSIDDVNRIGYFGSYARGDWGVGSDLDIIVILDHSTLLFEQRSLDWDTLTLPVPSDLVVYTMKEWQALSDEGSKFFHVLKDEVIWIYRA